MKMTDNAYNFIMFADEVIAGGFDEKLLTDEAAELIGEYEETEDSDITKLDELGERFAAMEDVRKR